MITTIKKIIGKQRSRKESEGWEQYLRPVDGSKLIIDKSRNKDFIIEESKP